MVVTGLTKLKMGDTFSDMLNVTLATRYGRIRCNQVIRAGHMILISIIL